MYISQTRWHDMTYLDCSALTFQHRNWDSNLIYLLLIYVSTCKSVTTYSSAGMFDRMSDRTLAEWV